MDEGNPGIYQISILGPPTISLCGKFISIPRRQARALIYRISADLQPIPREQLCFLFWPDVPESTARRNLTHLITHVRRSLPNSSLIQVLDGCIGLNPELVWSDCVTFKTLSSGKSNIQTHRGLSRFESDLIPVDDCGALKKSIDLYRGSFLNGFVLPTCPEFETWATYEKNAYEAQYLKNLATLVSICQEKGNFPNAIQYAQRYLEFDGLAEGMHRKIIELHGAMGDLIAVQRQFEQCCIILERELGVSPLPETWETYRTAIEGRESHRERLSPPSPQKIKHQLDIPFVGRKEILAQFENIVNEVHAGNKKIVLLFGDAGIGKSRVMNIFHSLNAYSTVHLEIACQPGTRNLPYYPILEIIRSALKESIPFDHIDPVWLSEVTRVLPELHNHFPNLPSPLPVGVEEARVRLFSALYEVIVGLASGPFPLFLFLDNLHWTDPSTMEWLLYMGDRLIREMRGKLIVICAYRRDENNLPGEAHLALKQLSILVEIILEGLDPQDILQLIRHYYGISASEQVFADHLHQVTGGNPFFVLEILRLLFETGCSLDDTWEPDKIPIPNSIREAIHKRLAQLKPIERQVFDTAAVLGTEFSFPLVQMAAGREEIEILDSLEALTGFHLLVEQQGVYQFANHLTRKAVYADLSYWRRRLLHRRVGNAYEKLDRTNLTQLAWHFEQGEEPGKAAKYALEAGIKASKIFAYKEARTFFDRALILIAQEAKTLVKPGSISTNRRMHIQVISWRGWVFRLLGDMQAYFYDLQEETRLAKSLGAPDVLADVYIREAKVHNWFCRYSQAKGCADKAIHLSRQAKDPLLEALSYRASGLAFRATGDFIQAQEALEKALEIFKNLKSAVLTIHTLGNLSTLYWLKGEFEQALLYARLENEECDEANLVFDRRLALGDMGVAEAARKNTDYALSCLLESLSISQQIADRTQEIFCRGHLGWLAVQTDKPEEALDYLQTGLAMAEKIDSKQEQSWLQAGLARAYALLGKMDLADTYARRALQLAETLGMPHERDQANMILAELHSQA